MNTWAVQHWANVIFTLSVHDQSTFWMSWRGDLLMDEHLVKIPEDLAMTITAELEDAEWRELAKVFMDDVWAEYLAIANGDADDK